MCIPVRFIKICFSLAVIYQNEKKHRTSYTDHLVNNNNLYDKANYYTFFPGEMYIIV